jgi:hypothetical protein
MSAACGESPRAVKPTQRFELDRWKTTPQFNPAEYGDSVNPERSLNPVSSPGKSP